MDYNVEFLPVEALKPYENNAKTHPAAQVERIALSIQQFGFRQNLVIDKDNCVIIGHGRLLAAKQLGLDTVPCVRVEDLTEQQIKALRLADNKVAESEWDTGLLDIELAGISDIDMAQFGFLDIDVDSALAPEREVHGKLTDKFLVPPFSILDARQGYWNERKKAWREIIGDNAESRDNLLMPEILGSGFNGTSLLDPVLSEIICQWFTPSNACNVFDCFAGDTVFGYVSATMGHTFTGIELRQEQCDLNNARTAGLQANYICDDGRNVGKHIKPATQDLLFSCPPYFDLEVYSDNPNDASNQGTYSDFYKILDDAFTAACACLKDNRFAVVVCGDIRAHDTGEYYAFPDDIKRTFMRNGLKLYNEIILIDPIGTAAVRASRYMRTRKVCKVHQNILVFYKGDTSKIKDEFPEIEVAEDASEDMER